MLLDGGWWMRYALNVDSCLLPISQFRPVQNAAASFRFPENCGRTVPKCVFGSAAPQCARGHTRNAR